MDGLTSTLISYGPPGIIILVLLLALRRIFDLYVETQEKRINERGESVKALEENSDALDKLSIMLRERGKGP